MPESIRSDTHTTAKTQNARLADLLRADWYTFKVVQVERMERVDTPANKDKKGWRLTYKN